MDIYQVDAFCKGLFSGNLAAVCPLPAWPDDTFLQQIAAENNLAETAFYVEDSTGFHIRWFTPKVEVDLCGHATLATAHVLFHHLGYNKDQVLFTSRSGVLSVTRNGELLTLDFPVDVYAQISALPSMRDWLRKPPLEVYRGKTDYLFVYEDETDIRYAGENLAAIALASHIKSMFSFRRDFFFLINS
ncbi:MAG: hypothetical protein DI535_00655 [Citrobacter freundii]|nr:MAG: hypothetical protein DI535_00655 [Citrobacter freundii]